MITDRNGLETNLTHPPEPENACKAEESKENPNSTDNMDEFKKGLTNLINRHSIENLCDMPDFLLSDMICAYLVAFGSVNKQNLDWHGCDSVTHPRCGPPIYTGKAKIK